MVFMFKSKMQDRKSSKSFKQFCRRAKEKKEEIKIERARTQHGKLEEISERHESSNSESSGMRLSLSIPDEPSHLGHLIYVPSD